MIVIAQVEAATMTHTRCALKSCGKTWLPWILFAGSGMLYDDEDDDDEY